MTEKAAEHRPALVTGGTGLLGSHIAEQLRRRGYPVRALCRRGSDTAFLKSIGAEIVEGDLGDRESIRNACQGMDSVYHAAARVGDWGPWEEFVKFSIVGTQFMLDAAAEAKCRRFLHISSISTYGHPNVPGLVLDETAPLGPGLYKWSYYSRAKVEAEKLVWAMHKSGRLPISVIRPSWMYGERDRATMPRLIEKIRRKKVKLIGNGENRLNVTHAGNVAEAAIMAVESEQAIGEAYNVCHDGIMTQGQYFNMVAKALGEPPITKTVPYSVAYNAAFLMECFGHLFKTRKPPLVTRYAVWLIGRVCFFECKKVKEQLGWSSSISYEEGVPAAVRDHIGDIPGSNKTEGGKVASAVHAS
ncbi:MAG: NAD-dependent epimerase/dehydratase family protein [Planctomycetota bacterium]|jgi:nucleoside-diphosphate-sugar epimerase